MKRVYHDIKIAHSGLKEASGAGVAGEITKPGNYESQAHLRAPARFPGAFTDEFRFIDFEFVSSKNQRQANKICVTRIYSLSLLQKDPRLKSKRKRPINELICTIDARTLHPPRALHCPPQEQAGTRRRSASAPLKPRDGPATRSPFPARAGPRAPARPRPAQFQTAPRSRSAPSAAPSATG